MNKILFFLSVVLLPTLVSAQKKEKPAPKVYDLIIGGYTTADNTTGIAVYRFYAETGKMAFLSDATIKSPTYLCVSPDRKFVYASSEARDGLVTAFSFDYPSGKLDLINTQPSVGANPVHITIDKAGKNVLVSNYGGTLSVLPVNKDGSLAAATQTIKEEGKSLHPQRQAASHIHSVTFSPDEKYVLYADLGTDKITVAQYKSSKTQPISTEDVAVEHVKPGSGPRHMEFAPDGKFMYLVNELAGSINVFSYNKGKLALVDSVNMTPPGFTGTNAGADIHLTPDGRFLYATNRGTVNELFGYAVNQTTGKLQNVYRNVTGIEPRNFVIEPGGNFLLVAARQANTVQVYKIDKPTGILQPMNNPINTPAPTVLKLVSAE